MSKHAHLEAQWPEVLLAINDSDHEYDLSEDCLNEIIDCFNIKIQKCSTGFTCFQGHQVGHAQNGKSAGGTFSKFLKAQGFTSSSTLQEVQLKYSTP